LHASGPLNPLITAAYEIEDPNAPVASVFRTLLYCKSDAVTQRNAVTQYINTVTQYINTVTQ